MHSRNQKILYTKTITSLIFTIFKWVLTMSHNKDKNSGLSVCRPLWGLLGLMSNLKCCPTLSPSTLFSASFPSPIYTYVLSVSFWMAVFSSVPGHSRLLLYLPFTIMVCSRPAWEGQLGCHSETFPGFFGRNSILLSLCFFIFCIVLL